MPNIQRPGKVALGACVALFVLCCATLPRATHVESEHDPAFDFAPVKTYRFRIEKGPAREEVDQRVRAETRLQLTKKGLRELPPGDETPDVLVSYAVGSSEVLVPGFVIGPGWYGGLAAYPGADAMVTGGLLLEMGDARTGKAVWVATYVMQGNNPQALMVMLDRVEEAVRGAVAEYPPR